MTGDIKNLVQSASSGDADAFASLYEMYAQDAYRYALYLTGQPQDAEDAVQNAAMKAFRGIRALKKPDSFKSWFMRIVHSACMDALRQRRTESIDALPETAETPELGLRSDLAQALAALDDQSRSIVLLQAVAGYRSREIAQMLGLNANTVRSKYARALEKLRAALS